MNYLNLRQKPAQFFALTSLSVSEFDDLLSSFVSPMNRSLSRTSRGTIRRNKISLPLSLPDYGHLLFFILTYLKLNPTHEHHGASFDMSQESASRWIKLCLKALNAALNDKGHLPLRNGNDFASYLKKKEQQLLSRSNPSEQQAILDRKAKIGVQCFVDASDIGIQRPLCPLEQKDKYSGKHKGHKAKNTYIINEYSKVLYLGHTANGNVHDKKLIEQDAIQFPDEAFLWKDLGYQGYCPQNVHCFEPHKKPKNKELTDEQKSENQLIASIRIVAEHAIGGVKRCRILKDTIRLYCAKLRDKVIETCVGLHNFRISKRKKYKVNEIFTIPQ